jgi:predicted Na+-dependent transporter
VLPVLVLAPMLAGSLLDQSLSERARMARGWTVTLAVASVAILQLVAWCLCASNSASTGRSLSFLSHAAWAPPAGWTLWAVIAALGTIALIAYGATYLGAGGAAVRRVRSADFVTRDGLGSPRVT